jgi:hypothetical protein
MRRGVSLGLAAMALLLALGAPGAAEAHGRWHRHHHDHGWGWWGPRVIVGVPPPWGWGWGWGWYGRPYYPPAVIVREEPEVYVERPAPAYWYYCESAEAYYPRVPSCPEPWLKVPPVPE